MDDSLRFRVWDTLKKKYDEDPLFLDELVDLIRIAEFDDHIDRVQNQEIFIIERCTGLRDKHGELMYVGDIVCYDDTPYNGYATKKTGVIVYRNAQFCYKYSDCLGGLYQPLVPSDDFWQRKTEIIGNVHEMGVKDE